MVWTAAALAVLALPAPPQERPEPVFTEDFESFDRSNWDEFGQHPDTVEVVDGGVGGGKCVQITATLGRDTGGHLYKMLEPGLDTCHLRFYVKFEQEHDHVHHFVHLVGYRPATRWPQGGAGERPRGDERFSTGIEPWGDWGRLPPPGNWHFYSYWCEMARAPDGKYWGNAFEPDPPVPVERGRWICVEIMVKCNSRPEVADGEQAVWIDGVAAGRWTGIRWRKHEDLKVNGVWMLDYVTADALRRNRVAHPREQNRVFFDEIVVSDRYVGPIGVCAFEGRAVDADGRALDGVRVSTHGVHPPGFHGGFGPPESPITRTSAATGGDGRFRLGGLLPGGYRLRFWRDDLAPVEVWASTDSARGPATTDVPDVVLHRGAALRGRVVIEGAPAGGIEVAIVRKDAEGRVVPLSCTAVTGDDGRFRAPMRLAPGRYEASAARRGLANPLEALADRARSRRELTVDRDRDDVEVEIVFAPPKRDR